VIEFYAMIELHAVIDFHTVIRYIHIVILYLPDPESDYHLIIGIDDQLPVFFLYSFFCLV